MLDKKNSGNQHISLWQLGAIYTWIDFINMVVIVIDGTFLKGHFKRMEINNSIPLVYFVIKFIAILLGYISLPP